MWATTPRLVVFVPMISRAAGVVVPGLAFQLRELSRHITPSRVRWEFTVSGIALSSQAAVGLLHQHRGELFPYSAPNSPRAWHKWGRSPILVKSPMPYTARSRFLLDRRTRHQIMSSHPSMMLSADALGRARAAGETVGTGWPVGGCAGGWGGPRGVRPVFGGKGNNGYSVARGVLAPTSVFSESQTT